MIFLNLKGKDIYKYVFDFPFLMNLKIICSCSLPDITVVMKRSFYTHFRILLLLEVDVRGVIQVN